MTCDWESECTCHEVVIKLRHICCHPQFLKSEAARRVQESAKLEYLTQKLLPNLLEEGRRILDLQKRKASLVDALLSEETNKLNIDDATFSHLLPPMSGA